ncbi:hypothetical protein Nepgr_026229 [Nepenthes gracilis]|uniref:Uncharacterized protein n=1 Tax=Nepenthes gracilis TaxID=150966 RepID=A0AAD3T887_NEPGR|nr:hypothetical protein Nepgr_026229 [Nepenthes gracilis]
MLEENFSDRVDNGIIHLKMAHCSSALNRLELAIEFFYAIVVKSAGVQGTMVRTSIVVIEEVEMDVPEHVGILEVGEPEQVPEFAEVAETDGLGQAPEPTEVLEATSSLARASPEPLSRGPITIEEVGA